MEREVSLSSTDYAQLPAELYPAIKEAISSWNDVYNVIRYATKGAILSGPPGTGKSTAATKHGLNGRGVRRWSVSADAAWAGEIGYYMPGPTGAYEFKPGNCTLAWLNGERAVIDEFDNIGGDCIPGYQGWLDDSAVAKMTLPNGETISPKDGFKCFATTNYPDSIPEALQDRFPIKRTILFPDPRILFSLPRAVRPAAGFALYGANTDKALAKLRTRSWVEIGALMDRHGLSSDDAIKLVVGPKEAKAVCLAVQVAAAKVSSQEVQVEEADIF